MFTVYGPSGTYFDGSPLDATVINGELRVRRVRAATKPIENVSVEIKLDNMMSEEDLAILVREFSRPQS